MFADLWNMTVILICAVAGWIIAFIMGMAYHSTMAHHLPDPDDDKDENTEKKADAKQQPKLTYS